MSDEAGNPTYGWIKPSKDDEIINSARLGLGVYQIADDLETSPARVKRVLVRAHSYGFLTREEAYRLGLLEAMRA